MAATIDTGNVASLTGSGASPKTFSCTCASADNCLIVLVGTDTVTAAAAPTGVTYNGVALTSLGSLSFTNNYRGNVSAWYLMSPPTGSSYSVSIAFANTETGFGACAIPLSGVDTSTVPTIATNHATSAAASVSVTGAGVNDVQMAQCFIRSTSLVSSQTAHLIAAVNGINSLDGFSADYIPGASAGNFAWTLTSGDWLALGVTVYGVVTGNTTLLASAGEYDLVGTPASSDFSLFAILGSYSISAATLTLLIAAIQAVMTLVAPPPDTSGAALLAAIAQMRVVVSINNNPLVQAALVQQLNMLECEAIDHFMATYWCTAARILSTIAPIIIDKNAAAMLVAIATAKVQAAAAAGGPTASWCAQYVNQLQTELVDYYMNTAAITAASILNTMTGVQSQPFNYVSNYTYYQADIEG